MSNKRALKVSIYLFAFDSLTKKSLIIVGLLNIEQNYCFPWCPSVLAWWTEW